MCLPTTAHISASASFAPGRTSSSLVSSRLMHSFLYTLAGVSSCRRLMVHVTCYTRRLLILPRSPLIFSIMDSSATSLHILSAPSGIMFLSAMYEPPEQRQSGAAYGIDGFYLGSAQLVARHYTGLTGVLLSPPDDRHL